MKETVSNVCKVLALCSQKGGVGKTTSCVNLAVGLAREGKRVLVVDNDPQGSMTASLGYHNPDELNVTLATILMKIVNEETFDDSLGILRHEEGIDLLPANIELAGMEVSLVNFMSRELVLRQYIDQVKGLYDYVLIDCMPSLGMLTINALACADAVLIPVQAAYLPVKGLEDLIRTIGKVRRQLNRGLSIEGILITMVDRRTTYARDITELIHDNESSKTESYPSIHHDRKDVDKMDERYAYRQIICDNIEYDILCQSYKPESVEELVELMLDAICTTKKYLQINGEAMPAQVVKNRLLKVGYEHIQYVFFSLSKNTTKVKNIRQYMLTVLYNAPVTINQFYDAEVRHDMYGG